jgi:YVTN family beta-propeller protein
MNSEAVAMRKLVILGIVSLVLLAGCGGGSYSNQSTSGTNPTPTITTVSPTSAVAGGAAFTLTINGTNFVAASMVNFGGTARTTTFYSATQLTAAIPAAAIASAGTAALTVTNPAPGGGTSNTVNFTITSGTNPVPSGTNPVPTINSLSPSCVPNGEQALNPFANGQLLVNGQNFVDSSVVRWNGSDLPTVFAAWDIPPGLAAQIPASDIAVAGTAAVTVFNPPPGGGSSNTLTFTITAGGVSPQSIAVDPMGKFAYVANMGCPFGYVSIYTINPTTGALASIGPPVASGDEGAHFVAVHPSGKFVYVVNWGEGDTTGSVSMYTISAPTGALTSTGRIDDSPCGIGSSPSCSPFSVAMDPTGKFAYVANEGSFAPTNVSMFTINSTTGALTLMGTIVTGGRAISVAVDPTGKFVYVATHSEPPGSAGVVSMYTINASTGALTSIGLVGTGTDPASVAVDPTGKFTYVTNSGSNDVSMYTVNATTGVLTSLGPIAAGTAPGSVAVDPSGKFAYVTNSGSNNISMYSINTTTGALTSIGTIAAGSSPNSIAIHPSGKFAYVTNSGSNDVTMYSIDAITGALTLIGTIAT